MQVHAFPGPRPDPVKTEEREVKLREYEMSLDPAVIEVAPNRTEHHCAKGYTQEDQWGNIDRSHQAAPELA